MKRSIYSYEVNEVFANGDFYDSQFAEDYSSFYEALKAFIRSIEYYKKDGGNSNNFCPEREYLEGCVIRIGKKENETINDVLETNEISIQFRIELNIAPTSTVEPEEILMWTGFYDYVKNIIVGDSDTLYSSNVDDFMSDYSQHFSSLSDLQIKEIRKELELINKKK